MARERADALLRAGRLRAARDAYARAGAELAMRSADVQLRLLDGTWRPPALDGGGVAPRPGRIVHLVGASLPHLQNGYTLRTHRVATAQRAAGLDPHVATPWGWPWPRGRPSPAVRESVDGIPHWRLGEPAAAPLGYDDVLEHTVTGLAALLQRLAPAALQAASDFVHARIALALGRRLGIPVVYEVRGLWDESWVVDGGPRSEADELNRLRRDRELDCMRAADRAVTLSGTMRAELVAHGIPAEHVVVLPNGVDVRALPEPPPPDPGREPVVGYVGSVVPYEGLDVLLHALGELRRQGRGLRALVVGGGSEQEAGRLRALATRLGLAGRVELVGAVPYDEVARWYREIDVLCLPRRDEPACRVVAPLKLAEAMASGRPVVASDLPPMRELVSDRKSGLLVRPGDSGELAAALAELLGDPARRHALGAAARAWVTEHRTWSAVGSAYRELYGELTAAPARAR